MSTFAKIMVVVNFVLAIAFLAAAGTLYGSAESWQLKHKSLTDSSQQEIAALNAQLKTSREELATARNERASMETRSATAEGQLKQLSDSNANLMRELQEKNAEIAKFQASTTELTAAVTAQTGRNEQLSNQVAQLTADKATVDEASKTLTENLTRETARADNAEKDLATAQAANKTLTDQVDQLTVHVAAYRAKVGPLPGGETVTAPVRGVVQRASAKDDIYVISVGQKDGVKVGYEFTVSRGGKYVSTIVVDAVYPNHAAARTKTGMKKSDVMDGDSIATPTGL